MTWLDRFLEMKIGFLVPCVPTLETEQLCESMRDKSLVPYLPQGCPAIEHPHILLASVEAVGQKPEALRQVLGGALSPLETASVLEISRFGAYGASGTRLSDDEGKWGSLSTGSPLHDLWVERSAILEFEAGFTRPEAEARATSAQFTEEQLEIILRLDPKVDLVGLARYRQGLELWERFTRQEQALLQGHPWGLQDLQNLHHLLRTSGPGELESVHRDGV